MCTSNWHRLALFVLVLLVAVLLAPGNSDTRRLNWHEILVAQTASEMLERNDFVVPRILGKERLKKPPLSYWLAAATHRLLGDPDSSRVSEFEARLPSLISGLLIIIVVYGLGRLLTRDPRGGLIAAALMASCVAFYLYSRSARPEMVYALFCALMTFGLVWAVRRAESGQSTVVAAALTWGSFALSLMAKGPQFPMFILLGVLLTVLIRRTGPPLMKTWHPWMALLAIAVPVSYYAFLAFRFDYAVALWQNEMMGANRGSLWLRPLHFYYPAILVVGLAPWIILFGYTVMDVWKRRDPMALLLANCVLVSIFLVSFAGQHRPHYVLPLLPLCAALMAWSILAIIDSDQRWVDRSRRFRLLVWAQFAVPGILIPVVIGQDLFKNYNAGAELEIYPVISWLVIATVTYAVAAKLLRRNLASGLSVLVGAVLLASGAYPWLQLDRSVYAESAYRFVSEVEAYLPEHSQLYFDSGKHIHYFYNYFGKRDIDAFSLKQWKKSATAEATPYFITQRRSFRSLGIEGEVLVEQQLHRKDKSRDELWVLFQPATRN